MIEVMPVEEYNRKEEAKYREAVSKFEYGTGGFPSRAMYLFLNEDGSDRTEGFVASIRKGRGSAHYCRKTEKEAYDAAQGGI
jgi:hypothetical protein